ncbi:cell division protein ZapA [Dichotomicrobium thermohalophilum]|uniref:Cell division protein ZapA n=1 Tax=Dichotomicrobium thermohalophilum TaxID=933063 RepID=A0A397Q1S6_9HYPH|nr:cell division protein ZapA [Dichotomicrobium thermohalophilum]RIA55450.1 cell division protein ZapA [Dichotomicrobium thermohalophilum]
MPQVTLTIGNKTYRLSCAEGEEPRIHALASHFAARVDEIGERFPRMPSDQLFLMAALIVTDELFEAREELQGTLKQIARLGNALNDKSGARGPSGSEMAQIVKDASARLNTLGNEKPAPPKSGSLAAGGAKPGEAAGGD